MEITTYPSAESFLVRARVALEADEPVCSLMLGICLRMARRPERVTTPPYLATVEDDRGNTQIGKLVVIM